MKRYTLVEILVSIAVIAILFGMAIGATSYVKTKIARSNTQTTMKLIEMAFQKYKNDFGMYPYAANGTDPRVLSLPAVNFASATTDQLKASLWGYFNDVTADSSNPKIRGLILSGNGPFYIMDGWKNYIIYICPGVFNTESFDLISGGEDAQLDLTTSIKTKTIPSLGASERTSIGGWNVGSIADDITNFTKN